MEDLCVQSVNGWIYLYKSVRIHLLVRWGRSLRRTDSKEKCNSKLDDGNERISFLPQNTVEWIFLPIAVEAKISREICALGFCVYESYLLYSCVFFFLSSISVKIIKTDYIYGNSGKDQMIVLAPLSMAELGVNMWTLNEQHFIYFIHPKMPFILRISHWIGIQPIKFA